VTALRWAVGAILTLAIIAAGAAAILFGMARDNPKIAAAPEPDYATIERTARQSAIALLTYEYGTVERSLNEAKDLTTGSFRTSYTAFVDEVLIPTAKDKRMSVATEVPAVGVAEADESSAMVLLFINQTTTTGGAAPNETASSVRMHMVDVDGEWLVDEFHPT
jgi:Mce-associated membrane protein